MEVDSEFRSRHIYKTILPLFYPLWACEASNFKKGIKGQKKVFALKTGGYKKTQNLKFVS
jgi:hypothetical protein